MLLATKIVIISNLPDKLENEFRMWHNINNGNFPTISNRLFATISTPYTTLTHSSLCSKPDRDYAY